MSKKKKAGARPAFKYAASFLLCSLRSRLFFGPPAGPLLVRCSLRVLALRRVRGRLRAVHQLDVSHRRVVTLAGPIAQDAQIAAVALGVARAELVEYLDHHVAVAQPVEGEPPVRE